MKHVIHDLERVIHDSNPDLLEPDDLKAHELIILKHIRDDMSAENSRVDRMIAGLIERMKDDGPGE
jgi:hypothetical protein